MPHLHHAVFYLTEQIERSTNNNGTGKKRSSEMVRNFICLLVLVSITVLSGCASSSGSSRTASGLIRPEANLHNELNIPGRKVVPCRVQDQLLGNPDMWRTHRLSRDCCSQVWQQADILETKMYRIEDGLVPGTQADLNRVSRLYDNQLNKVFLFCQKPE
mgnify:CR=1 FL=1